MKTLILTEKPSVAKDIAIALDPNVVRNEGYFTALNCSMFLTYAFGHLYQIAGNVMPRTIEEDLPFFPAKFLYEPTKSGAERLNDKVEFVDYIK